jgi:hypothetical protein
VQGAGEFDALFSAGGELHSPDTLKHVPPGFYQFSAVILAATRVTGRVSLANFTE